MLDYFHAFGTTPTRPKISVRVPMDWLIRMADMDDDEKEVASDMYSDNEVLLWIVNHIEDINQAINYGLVCGEATDELTIGVGREPIDALSNWTAISAGIDLDIIDWITAE